jgi:hypothetical protein
VSAAGETLSAPGTAVSPSSLSTIATMPATGGAVSSGAVTAAPAATPPPNPYPFDD